MVPPRFSLRSTGRCVLRSICWASISPIITCSVKFFEPTTTRSECEQEERPAAITRRHNSLENRFSIAPRPKSAMSASAAAGMAPARIRRLSTIETPRKMNMPSPPAPTAAAIVATPTQSTVATRSPAKMTLRAKGISTLHNNCRSVIPIPRPASRMAGSTPEIPVNVLRMIGNSEYRTNATIAVRAPIPPMNGNGIKKPNKARLGIVWTAFANVRIGPLSPGLRVIRTPRGRPIPAAMSIDNPTNTRCSSVSWATSIR